jgi:hypothetical protein
MILKNLRTRLLILSVSLVSVAGPLVVIMGRIRGLHDGGDL